MDVMKSVTLRYSLIYRNITKIECEDCLLRADAQYIDVIDMVINKYGPKMHNAVCLDRDKNRFSVMLVCNGKMVDSLTHEISEGDLITFLPRIVGG